MEKTLDIENEVETRFNFKTNINLLCKEFDVKKSIGSTGIGEAYAIIKALENIKAKYDKINIYLDNHEVFYMFNSLSKKRAKKVLLNKITDKYTKLSKNKNIAINWIKGHVGVYGNEIADRLATKALKNVGMPYCNGVNNQILFEFDFFNSFILDKIKLQKEPTGKTQKEKDFYNNKYNI